jgi:uncharacterized protein YhaN
MPEVRDIAFELERFGWSAPGQLEVVGRWSGLEGRRLGRPVLTIEAGGRRRRLTALPGGHLTSGDWRATFACDEDPAAVASVSLEVARRLVVDLPAPKPLRRRPREVIELEKERERRKEVEATLAERDAELVSLREEADAALAKSEAEIETLGAELESLRPQVEDRDALAAELESAKSDLERTRDELANVRAKLELERAATTDLHERIASAREEAEATMVTESRETERLRAELEAAREETERAVTAEQAETARLREELAATTAADANGGEPDDAAKRMYERIAKELETERAAARSLRRELDAVQAKSAEERRSNGVTEDVPAATPAGRLAASRRMDAGRAAAAHRADVARAASAHRVPHGQRSAGAVWAVRVTALLFVLALLLVGLLIVSWVT